jgi:hypothetical protein
LKSVIAIFFDTSALRQLGWNAAPLSTVLELSKAGLVDVYLPELVIEERRTQWAEAPKQAVADAIVALRSLLEDPILPPQHVEQVRAALDSTSEVDVDAISVDGLDHFLRSNRVNQLPLTFEQSKAAWKAYFSGAAPHRKPKNRDDIPDAHIFEAAKGLIDRTGLVHFVCADKRLAGALQSLRGAKVYENLEELFQAGTLADPTHLWARDKRWRNLQHRVSADAIEAEVRKLLEDDLDDHLVGVEFMDFALPGEDSTARVLWAMGGELISIQNPDDWGGGIMSFEVECESDAGIGMTLSQGEARILPDWLDVQSAGIGRVDLTGNVRLKVEATVDVEVDLENVEKRSKPLLAKADFDDLRLFII